MWRKNAIAGRVMMADFEIFNVSSQLNIITSNHLQTSRVLAVNRHRLHWWISLSKLNWFVRSRMSFTSFTIPSKIQLDITIFQSFSINFHSKYNTNQKSTNQQPYMQWLFGPLLLLFGIYFFNPSAKYSNVSFSAENTAKKLNAANAKNSARTLHLSEQIRKEKSPRNWKFQDICKRIGRRLKWMDGWLKNESHSLSQSEHSYWVGNGLKEDWSFVWEGRSFFKYLILWNQWGSRNQYLKNIWIGWLDH